MIPYLYPWKKLFCRTLYINDSGIPPVELFQGRIRVNDGECVLTHELPGNFLSEEK